MRILIFDTETTDLKGWIVEVAYLVLVPEGEKLRVVKGKASGINPLKPVSPYVRKRFFLDEEKVKGSFERIRERLNYDPAKIREREILFHSALFDVVALGHLVSKAWKLIRAETDSPPLKKLL